MAARKTKAAELALMKEHQDWVKMHVDTSLDARFSVSGTRFLQMVKGLIPEDKYKVFLSLLRWPLPTTALTSVVFDRLSRVFEGRNATFNYQFEKTEFADDWEWYRQEVLKEPHVWRNKGWQYYRTEPNSVLVVDLPQDQGDDTYPRPYFYWVTVDDIIDYGTHPDGRIEWIVYKDDRRRMVYMVDEYAYRCFHYADADVFGEMISENPHGLGYCPAMFFVDTPISLSHPDVKRSPITDVLSELDWFLFFATSKKHLDTYGSYPIYSGYERDCGYEVRVKEGEHEQFHHCEGGILVDDSGLAVMDAITGKPRQCPKCGGHRIAGAGSYIEVPAPGDGVPDMRNPIQILSVDKASLEWNADEMERMRSRIIATCVGVDGEGGISEFGASEQQINAAFESQSTILIRVKKQIENAQAFVDATCCRLRYGNMFTSLSVNYGTEFYTMTTGQLRKRYAEAKEGGASEADLAALRRQVVETEYRNDGLQLQRQLILSEVEPLNGLGREEAMQAYEKGLVDADDMKVKLDFDSLVRRFERENGNVINFGVALGFADRIAKIKQTLIDYVKN